MLNNAVFKSIYRKSIRASFVNYFLFSNLAVRDIKGKCIVEVQDRAGELQYMREVETQDGKKGIVLKIEQPYNAYIGFYHPITTDMSQLKIKNKNIPWQQSLQPILKQILNRQNPSLFDSNNNITYTSTSKSIKQDIKTEDRMLHSLSPILQICYDLSYGDMINFVGCRGSKKTTTALQMSKLFAQKNNHTSIFINPSSPIDSRRAVQQGSWSLQAGNAKNQTDIGVFMLAAKAVYLAELLMKADQNVLLVFDGFRHILQAEWHMVQLLNKAKQGSSQLSFSAPRLPPISTLNQIYSQCMDRQIRNGKGSCSAILINQKQKGDQLMPEITPYSNNLKHLETLSKNIMFPLTFKHVRTSQYITESQTEEIPNLRSCQIGIRNKINEYLVEKRQSELKHKLYKNQMTDAPWDYYEMLDTNWWMKCLQNTKCTKQEQISHLLVWIWMNIEMELVPHWKIDCQKAYQQYKKFLNRAQSQIGRTSLEAFTLEAKLKGIFSPFKKDYLG